MKNKLAIFVTTLNEQDTKLKLLLMNICITLSVFFIKQFSLYPIIKPENLMTKFAFLLTFIFFPVISYCQKESVDAALLKLDQCIEKRSSFESVKKKRIQSLENQFYRGNISLLARYGLSAGLYKEYQSYKYDSAYSYARRMNMFAEELKDPTRIAESKIAMAFSCMSAGLYKEASEIAASIDSSKLQRVSLVSLYSFLSTLYIEMATYSSPTSYQGNYQKQSLAYSGKTIQLGVKNSPEVIMARLRECQLKNDYPRLIEIAQQHFTQKELGAHGYAMVASLLGYSYLLQRDTLKAIETFVAAAVTDVEMATKETAAIQQLAKLLFERGDLNRAYLYANMAYEDANFYNARHRKIEVGNILPIIDAGRFDIIKRQKDKLLVFSVLISLLFILFLVATIIILKQKKRLDSARLVILKQNQELVETNAALTQGQDVIRKQNQELLITNDRLKEAHRIKDEYIGYFFSANSAYLEKIENFKKQVAKKLRNRQFEELMQLTDSSELQTERENMFALFDQIFVKLFPDFISRYNQLFHEEDRVSLKSDGALTSEIRIFALIRLGITDSERIAKFLNYSVHTVNNYKTKAKNRSVIPNELFEQKIMEFESVKSDI